METLDLTPEAEAFGTAEVAFRIARDAGCGDVDACEKAGNIIREFIAKRESAIPRVERIQAELVMVRDDLAAAREANEAMYRATEPIAIADENDITNEDGYVSINENTRKAIVKARAAIGGNRRREMRSKKLVWCPRIRGFASYVKDFREILIKNRRQCPRYRGGTGECGRAVDASGKLLPCIGVEGTFTPNE